MSSNKLEISDDRFDSSSFIVFRCLQLATKQSPDGFDLNLLFQTSFVRSVCSPVEFIIRRYDSKQKHEEVDHLHWLSNEPLTAGSTHEFLVKFVRARDLPDTERAIAGNCEGMSHRAGRISAVVVLLMNFVRF